MALHLAAWQMLASMGTHREGGFLVQVFQWEGLGVGNSGRFKAVGQAATEL